MSAANEHLAFEILAQLPADSHLARNGQGQWYVNVSPRAPMVSWEKFVANTPYEAIIMAANWYMEYYRRA